jgi:hypothetical protein
MVAMSIFSVIGISIVTLLGKATEFSRSGSSTTEILDSLQSFTEAFSDDASTLYSRSGADDGQPAVRLWSDVVRSDVDGDQKADATVRRLAFVRMVPDEATSSATRAAGTSVGAKEFLDQSKDAEQAEKGLLRATSGLMEVFWAAVPETKDDLAVMTLYRGVVSPIGQQGRTFFPTKVVGDPSAKGPEDRGPVTLDEIRARCRPVLSGVLHFGVEFWSRRTETWDPSIAPPKGPLEVWDSTRGIMRKGKGLDGFWFAKAEGTLERPTLEDPTDDTFPRRIRVTLVAEEAGQHARVGNVMGGLAADATFIEISDTSFIPATDTTQRYVKIGDEWIQFTSTESNRLTGCKRGVRGTTATAHEHGARVHYGRTVIRDLTVATSRDAYRDELPNIGGRR